VANVEAGAQDPVDEFLTTHVREAARKARLLIPGAAGIGEGVRNTHVVGEGESARWVCS